tara:strand:- start:533 stop:718 length:186 start_codon:yes stop_codon:yes gene_type:complete
MTFVDDDQTVIQATTMTINDQFDVVSVRFQMRRSELEAIATGTEADKDALIEWLTPAAEPE